ncbi:hypothetical protein TVAG_296720 [Trichomonas vaginalis G3]|uniref:Nuclear transport factor 2 n=1 Tax=Trichomonas vaginalis (strain ATCC PRA-98 / G3) TaxID=412133 RepID=A2FUS6_TRIV3|nr:NTF2-like family [Trichomonas vaginalis G3]EAX91340.1 hypothetical protein TVAG_296720 [Trichomonas vaginalis G3]KAI5485595.1 NTF2-like family [Trichomonas vaginalis G3]|eukprot:XP_001304270.1 hypothetical protein [Trichomonas vaginalis G3]
MSIPAAQTEHSLGIAKELAEKFLPLMNTDKEAMTNYFGENATLVFQGRKIEGVQEIHDFLADLGEIQLSVSSYDVQTIQSARSWTMVVITGIVLLGGSVANDFHCSLYVEANESNQVAFIRFMTFNYF